MRSANRLAIAMLAGSVFLVVGVFWFAKSRVSAPGLAQTVRVVPFQNPQGFELIDYEVASRGHKPLQPRGVEREFEFALLGEHLLTVTFKVPGYKFGQAFETERERFKDEVRAWLDLGERGLNLVHVYALPIDERASVTIPNYFIEEGATARLHISGQGGHAAYTISGFGSDLERRSTGVAGLTISGLGPSLFGIEPRAIRYAPKSEPGTVYTAFEVRLSNTDTPYFPFVTAINVWSDIVLRERNLSIGNARFGPGVLFSKSTSGMSQTGPVVARSEQLFADVEYVLLRPSNKESGTMKREGDRYVVRTKSYSLYIEVQGDEIDMHRCDARLNEPFAVGQYLIVQGMSKDPFAVLFAPDDEAKGLSAKAVDFAAMVGKDVVLSMADHAEVKRESFAAYVKDTEAPIHPDYGRGQPLPLTTVYSR